MNEKAKALGLAHTEFVDPSGAGAGNISTAEDLFRLLGYLRSNQSFFLNVSAGRAKNQLGASPAFAGLENFNGFGGSAAFLGGKIGRSEAAGETFASLFVLEDLAVDRPIAFIVLGSDNAIGDTAALVAYVRDTFTVTEP